MFSKRRVNEFLSAGFAYSTVSVNDIHVHSCYPKVQSYSETPYKSQFDLYPRVHVEGRVFCTSKAVL